jgi:hypothetical protein
MVNFKYILDKSSKKFQCPRCNKKTFVRYIEIETGNYLNDNSGRCDRESNCQYFLKPQGQINDFVINDLPKPEPSYHSIELLEKSYLTKEQNNFIDFLNKHFTEEEVTKAVSTYLISTSKYWKGATVFWQIDQLERLHHGKIMLFNSETGKRVKKPDGKGFINSVRSVLKLEDFNLNQCLFGLHLIKETNSKTIAIVEAEKTAILMSIFKPQFIWIATGSKSGFKYEYLKPIKEYKIVAFPDKGEFNEWSIKAKELNGFGFNIIVNDWLEKQQKYDPGTDLADVYINYLK